MSDEQKREAIARVLPYPQPNYAPGVIWMKLKGIPREVDPLSNIAAAFAIYDLVSNRFDVIIRKHNNGHWRVEFCEPSHEYSASHESLATAICDAFLAVPAPQP